MGDIKTQAPFLGQEDPQKEGAATHSSILPGGSHGQGSLAGDSSWGHKDSATLSTQGIVYQLLPHLTAIWSSRRHSSPRVAGAVSLEKITFSFSATLSGLSSSLPTLSPQKMLACQTFLPSIIQKPSSSFWTLTFYNIKHWYICLKQTRGNKYLSKQESTRILAGRFELMNANLLQDAPQKSYKWDFLGTMAKTPHSQRRGPALITSQGTRFCMP